MVKSRNSALLKVEVLEDRLAPAGNINVSVAGATVFVTGDRLGNGVEISPGATDNLVVFRGLDGTTINKSGDVFVLDVGTLDFLTVDLKRGNDNLVIANRSALEPAWPSSNSVLVEPFILDEDLKISCGAGEDTVQLTNLKVQGDLFVFAEAGNDAAVLEGVEVEGGATVTMVKGADSLLLHGVVIHQATSIDTGGDKDAVGLIASEFEGSVSVLLGAANDQVSVERNHFHADLTLKGGTGRNNQMTEDIEGEDADNDIDGTFTYTKLNDTLELVADVHYTFEGAESPSHWGQLTPAFLLAQIGRQQTPIAINTAAVIPFALPNLAFGYVAATNIPFVHTGHNIQVNYPAGSTLTVNGDVYTLLQFHFHTPSEHTVNGESFPMEIHLVHQNTNGALLVMTLLIKEGAANAAFDPLIANLPSEGDPSNTISGPFNPADLLPADRQYYAYTGSLTTPPASEGVSFGIFTNPVELSAAQIDAVEAAIGFHNDRPILPTNSRPVFISA